MTKRLAIIALAAIMMLGVFGLTGCDSNILKGDPDNPVVESECGYFNIMLRKIDGYAIVLDLTTAGKEQEILAIPSEVNGFVVKQIGWNTGGFAQVGIRSDVLKKLYVPYSVNDIALGFGTVEVVFLPAEIEIFELDWKIGCTRFIATTEMYKILDADSYQYWQKRFCQPNVMYFYNYDDAPNLGYFWFDNITCENLFVEPNDPTREGFAFTGWFLDEDCETKWDEVMPKSSDEKITLYAGWKASNN